MESHSAGHLVVDGHNDLPWAHRELAEYDLDACPIDRNRPELHTDLPRLRAGGVGAQLWSVFVPSTLDAGDAVRATLEQIDFVHRLAARYDDLEVAYTVADARRIMTDGRIASLLAMEGGHSIGDSLGVLRMFYELGVRAMTLTHNDNVSWADSATDEPAIGGLSQFGREVVGAMNDLGMAVDLSHVSADVMRDALEVSTAPVLFTHSNARAVCDVPRNVPEDVLATLRTNGGVCMVTFVPMFTTPAVGRWFEECKQLAVDRGLNPRSFADVDPLMKERALTDPPPVTTIDDVIAHLEHVREVAGIDHVGIGGDYDGTTLVTRGLEDVSTYPRLFAALRERGWSARDCDQLAGTNALRVLHDVERS